MQSGQRLHNKAAFDGPAAKPWWQDWRGECAAIIGSGPSVDKAEVARLRDRIHVIAIKANVDLAPWAEVVYGCDAHWWMARQGLPKYRGVKLAYDAATAAFKDIHRIEIDRSGDAILIERPGLVGTGGNSGFQALNLAVQFGATGILLLGYDMFSKGNSPHWYGRNDWLGCANPVEGNYNRWRKAFEQSVCTLQNLGVDVVNSSKASALECYRKASVEDALQGWGL